jgi:ABC-type transport system substrate-binding protein
LTRPDPTFVFLLASPLLSIVPREAVEADGADFAQRPTGSGPYVVRAFRPGSRLVLERNPVYRSVRWGDLAASQPNEPEWAAPLRERRFPVADRVELLHIAEPSAGLLALETGQIDVWPATEAASIVGGKLSPRLAKEGIRLVEGPDASAMYLRFNLGDPAIGGTTLERVSLRRAIAMAIDDHEFIRVIGHGRGRSGRHPIPPGIAGHDPEYRNPNAFDPAAANALLDRAGYRRGKDGYRRDPAGESLTVAMIVSSSTAGRRWAEFMKRSFDRIGVRASFEALPPAEHFKRMAACRFQLIRMDWGFDWPDGSSLMLAFVGAAPGSGDQSCPQDAEFDSMYEQLVSTPPGPTRDALYRRMIERLDAIMPGRLLPAAELSYLTRAGVRGWVIHPANFAPFPFVDPGSR